MPAWLRMRNAYSAREWCRQRSSTTSQRAGSDARSNTTSRSSIRSIPSPWRSKASNSSFSSARIREQSTPILTSLAPVFLFLGRQPEFDRVALDDFELGPAIGAGYDLALLDVRRELDIGRAFGTLRGYGSCHHDTSSIAAQPRVLIRSISVPASMMATATGPGVSPWNILPLTFMPPEWMSIETGSPSWTAS